jgi:hypothetical protein
MDLIGLYSVGVAWALHGHGPHGMGSVHHSFIHGIYVTLQKNKRKHSVEGQEGYEEGKNRYIYIAYRERQTRT